MDMDVVIEFCSTNLAHGSQKALDALMEDPELEAEIVEYGCLGNCSLCATTLYAMVNGEIVTGDSPEELVANIKAFLKKEREKRAELDKLIKQLDD